LFGLFEEPQEAPAPRETTVRQEDVEQVEVHVPVPTPKARKKLSSKNFTADLDDFLSDSFEREKLPRKVKDIPPGEPPKAGPRQRRKTGLDLLIRSTVKDEDRNPRGGNTAETKRVTLIFNKKHLAELKEQAKDRGMYLKDVVQEMVAEYLEK
ncbi:MAG: hypothetical protein AAFZ52_08395, partial [Bacteroidota bacterium]